MRLSRRVRFESTSELAPHQFSVLARLQDGQRTAGEIAAIERVSAPSMSRTVAGLVERGLVARQNDPDDGRQLILSLTAAGTAAIRRARRERDAWMATRLEGLSAGERATLARASEILNRLVAE